MSPAAALILLAAAWVAVLAASIRRDRRRRDPLALTDDELAALVHRHGEQGDSRG